ncbi:GLEYA domain-containing protein [Poronia punctata]|nr:GLEYA domain-containing protein [Poronia punctata]
MRSSTLISFILPAAVSAAPTTNSVNGLIGDLFCELNAIVIKALQADAAATSYCSSYLSIPTSTYTVTVTKTPTSVYTTVPVTVTGDTVTETTTSTAATAIDVTITETSTELEIETVTQFTATETLTCLSSAFTAPIPVPTALERREEKQLQSKPTCIPPSWPPAAISGACSCLSLPTPCTTKTVTKTLAPGTVTVTSTNTLSPTAIVTAVTTITTTNTHTETTETTATSTITENAEATTIVSNGLVYRKYEHSYDANLVSSGYTSTAFKSLTPDWTGVLTSLSFSSPNWPSGSQYLELQDHAAFLATQSAILLQGFFLAPETGTYTLSSSADLIDNWGYLWTGDVAYAVWDDTNTAFQASRTGAGNFGGSTTVTLNAGDAIPITWLWANGGGVAQSFFSVTTPSGSTTTDTTGFFVQPCSSEVFP